MSYDEKKGMVVEHLGKMPHEYEVGTVITVVCPECGEQLFIRLTETVKVETDEYVAELPIDPGYDG